MSEIRRNCGPSSSLGSLGSRTLSSHFPANSSMLTRETVRTATHIFCMTRGHRQGVEMLFPEAAEKTYLVCEFSPDDNLRGSDIPDPIGLGRAAYEETFRTLQRALPSILAYVDQTWKDSPPPSSD